MYGYGYQYTSGLVVGSGGTPVDATFKITVDTTKAGSASDTFVLPLHIGVTNMTVYWGDGNSDLITAYNQAELTHVYTVSGSYQITCEGSFTGIAFVNGGDKLKLSSIDNWGTNTWSKCEYSLKGCSNMVGTYIDSPDFSGATNMIHMFKFCSSFNSPLTITTPSVTNMSLMFDGCTNFNSDVTFLDTSSVSNMNSMFLSCTNFDKAINFNTSSLTNMSSMFKNCSSFNQTINFVSPLLTAVSDAFHGCLSLNSQVDIDVSSCASFIRVFYNCTVFDQDISGWDISSLTIANNMLALTAFSTANYDLLLPLWDAYGTSNVTFHAGAAQYNAGAPATAHANMLGRGWSITDSGQV